jgi:predicted RNase H-like nuclease (RuvC/YqgF family)
MTPAMLYQFLVALGSGIGGALFAYLSTRQYLMKAVQDEAATYKRLSEARGVELTEVRKRLDYLEQFSRTLETQNQELRDLNVGFQRENLELQDEIGRLQNRIDQLEAVNRHSPPTS